MSVASAWKTKKFLVANQSDIDSIIGSESLKVFIDGYSYTAVTSRNVTVANTITETTREDGMKYCDHDFREPTSMSYTIIVSKLNGSEYNKLKEIYLSRRLVPVKSIAYYCPNAIMSDFKVVDTYFDALEIGVSFKEVLVSGTDYTLTIESSFQTKSASNNNGSIKTSTNTNQTSTPESRSINDRLNSLSDNSNEKLMSIASKSNTTIENTYVFSGNETIAGNDKVVVSDDNSETKNYELSVASRCFSV